MKKKEYKENLSYFEEHGIKLCCEGIWDDLPFSVELETYTNGGEDMILHLEEPSKEYLQKYIDNFDIDEQVSMWWPGGRKLENKGVPFSNMKEHYEDYEEFLSDLQEICNDMPY